MPYCIIATIQKDVASKKWEEFNSRSGKSVLDIKGITGCVNYKREH